MVISQGVLAGFQAGQGSRSTSAIGQFIRGKLEEAKQKGLIRTQIGEQTQGAIELARAKSGMEQDIGKQFVIVTPQGQTRQVTTPEGGYVFPSATQAITPREATSAAEQAYEDALFNLKTSILSGQGEEDQNIIQQGAARGTATPVSSIIKTGQPAPRPSAEEELLKALEKLGGE